MCDEYEDERMRLFWRQLAVQEEHTQLDDKAEPSVELVGKPADEIVPRERARPRVMTR